MCRVSVRVRCGVGVKVKVGSPGLGFVVAFRDLGWDLRSGDRVKG